MGIKQELQDAEYKLREAETKQEYRRVINQLQNIYASITAVNGNPEHRGTMDPDELLAQARRELDEAEDEESFLERVTRTVQRKDFRPDGWEENALDELLNETIAVLGEMNQDSR